MVSLAINSMEERVDWEIDKPVLINVGTKLKWTKVVTKYSHDTGCLSNKIF